MSNKSSPSLLFHADANDPDMLYFSRFGAFDPYLAFTAGGKKIGVASIVEHGRMTQESAFDEVLFLPDLQKDAARRFKLHNGNLPDISQLVQHLAKEYKIREFRIGERFPAGLALELQKAGTQLQAAAPGMLLPEREIKTAAEVESLRKGNEASAAGFKMVINTLKESNIRNGLLVHQGKILTAERLRELIAQACLAKGAIAQHTITAAGDQACDCHNAGHGPIRANELIVVDIFPRRMSDGYWGDMTRTFLKGKASDAQRRLVRTVRKGLDLSLQLIKPGVTGGSVHNAVADFFTKEGYETNKNSDQLKGFFHALGHGVGLEIHESPIMRATSKWRFKKGMVITTEPGLYYRGLGGCRIEDVVHLVPGGCEKISSAPYRWEIA